MTGSDWLEETQTEKPLGGTWDRKEEKKVSCGLATMMWRQAESYSTHLGVSSTKESHTHC